MAQGGLFGKTDSREHWCSCGTWGSCSLNGRDWVCRQCAPLAFWPADSNAVPMPLESVAEDEDVI